MTVVEIMGIGGAGGAQSRQQEEQQKRGRTTTTGATVVSGCGVGVRAFVVLHYWGSFLAVLLVLQQHRA